LSLPSAVARLLLRPLGGTSFNRQIPDCVTAFLLEPLRFPHGLAVAVVAQCANDEAGALR
jgi:hypothetical protein